MTARTLTASAYLGNVKMNINGDTSVAFVFNSGATKLGTASDVVLLAKIPDKATLLGGWIRGGAGGDTQNIYRVELHDTAGTMLAIVAQTFTISSSIVPGVNGFGGNAASPIPYKVSITDTDAIRYATLKVVFQSGTETVSMSFAGEIRYTMDGL